MSSSAQIEKIVHLYKVIAQNATLSAARILKSENGVSIKSAWSQRNLERKTMQKYTLEHLLNSNLEKVYESFPIDVSTELISASTNDEELRAVVRQATVESDKTAKQFLEIWNKQKLIKNYDLSALDVHGDVYGDAEFGAFEWSPDKTKVLYVAEKKLPKSEPFYKQKSQETKPKDEDKEKVIGNEYIYKQDWGEQLVGKHLPVAVVLDTGSNVITPLPGLPDDVSVGQLIWSPDGECIVGVAWNHEPRRLGLVACTNRISWIFSLKDGVYQKLSNDGNAVNSPRFSPNGKFLVWLEREASGPHHNAHKLVRMDWEQNDPKVEVVVDIVESSTTINGGKPFYGLYSRMLRERCWSKDSRYLFISTPQRYNVISYVIDMETKTMTEIENDRSSSGVLDVKDNLILFYRTSLLEPWSLQIGRFDPSNIANPQRRNVTLPASVPGFENLVYHHMEHEDSSDESVKDFNSTYFGPNGNDPNSTPLIVAIHGGPHSAFANIFSLDYSLFNLLGYAVLQINYRGSTGMGSKNVEYLQGKVGDSDVKDCFKAIQDTLNTYEWLDPDRIGLYGGSHGGFLVAHLSAQYPDSFQAVVAKNPVIDIASMFTISDIPDWCATGINVKYIENGKYEESSVEMLQKMFKCSPIYHVNKVKAPTLVCIGKNDLRVPCSQGKMWYHRIKANNVTAKMLVYEDNHQLSTGPAEIDNIINATLWFEKHTVGDNN